MTNTRLAPVKLALLSVSNKEGITRFAKSLRALGIKIISTGGTHKLLKSEGIEVREVREYTGFPELMGGRVKTLHPKLHAGILGRRGIDDQVARLHDVEYIDLVVVNLYPFEQVVSDPDCSLQTANENIDIGGPAMIRAAAKNNRDVAVIVDDKDYDRVLHELKEYGGQLRDTTRYDLAVKAYEHTAAYDGAIANYFGKHSERESTRFPKTLNLQFHKMEVLRYGENPHQEAAFYQDKPPTQATICTANQKQGKALSYNNVADADAALECVKAFGPACCVIVKHANPCGVSCADSLLKAYTQAFDTDHESAFGGIIAFNRTLDSQTTSAVLERQFAEVIIAPEFEDEALSILGKRPNIRVLETGLWKDSQPAWDYKRINGGLLVQDQDYRTVSDDEVTVVSERPPSKQERLDLEFAWKIAKFVKSNAIVYAHHQRTIGVGAGQMSRVNSARIAAIKAEQANLPVKGAVMASDAFFPFRDGIDTAAALGISAVIQPGGSMRDKEVIAAANESNMAMIFTHMRHFRH